MRNSFFIVLYGVSGAGKSTLRDEAIKSFPKLKKLIAVTTRPPRQGEIEGVDKYFLTKDEFFDRNSSGELCLANKVYEHMYAFRLNDFKSGDVYICELYHRDYKAFRETGAINVNIYIKPYFLQKAFEGIANRGSSFDELEKRHSLMEEDHNVLEDMLENGLFNYTFINHYDEQSIDEFVKLINKIITNGGNA